MSAITFEEKALEIIELLDKKRSIWRLTSVPSIGFEDVKQIILIHIHKKWHMWDQSKPLKPWVNTIIINQVNNLLRNNYYNFTRPCLGKGGKPCAANEGGDLCAITASGKQCSECPLFARWEKKRKSAYSLKIPTSLDASISESERTDSKEVDFDSKMEFILSRMKQKLSPIHFEIFKKFYVGGMREKEVAAGIKVKNKTTEQKIRYFELLKPKFRKKVREIIEEEGW